MEAGRKENGREIGGGVDEVAPTSGRRRVEVSGQKNEAVYHLFGGEGSLTKNECPGKCSYRCSATSHTTVCMTYCNYCCERCLCVPSGTYGNKEECPCYNNMKTQEGKPKCP
uniref:Gibberellin regulated protein n=1 Tax=Oryza rufipogon TaxID=4529 RepID=A0A0E0QVP0_ORYRU